MSEEPLPSIDGKPLIKSPSKSTARHKRELMNKIAEKVGLSGTQFFRLRFIQEHGDPQIIGLLKAEKISTWRTYCYVRRKHDAEVFKVIEQYVLEKQSGEGQKVT